jgi:hypothetical protein
VTYDIPWIYDQSQQKNSIQEYKGTQHPVHLKETCTTSKTSFCKHNISAASYTPRYYQGPKTKLTNQPYHSNDDNNDSDDHHAEICCQTFWQN